MGLRGPQSKSNHLKLATRTADEQAASVVPESTELPCPPWLSDSARAIWAEVCEELKAIRALSFVDRQMISLYVDSLARCRDLICTVNTSEDSDERARALLDLNKEKRIAFQLAAHFGLTPGSRSRMTFTGTSTGPMVPPEDDPFA